MTLRWLYTAMWNALHVLYKERPDDEELEFWVDDGDPYIWAGRYSKVEVIQDEFEDYVCKIGMAADDYDEHEGYGLVSRYIHERTPWADRFDDISEEEWSKLWKIIEDDEDAYIPYRINEKGRWANPAMMPASIKGKTIKSIEYAKVGGEPMARSYLQINLGRAAGRLWCVASNEPWVGGLRGCRGFAVWEHDLDEPFSPAGARPHAYMVDEVVTGVELAMLLVRADGYSGVLPVQMGLTLRTRYGTHCFYRRGMESDLIHVSDHVPTDEELGADEVAAFWSEGVTGFSMVRDDWALQHGDRRARPALLCEYQTGAIEVDEGARRARDTAPFTIEWA